MDKKAVKTKAKELLSSGTPKSQVFTQLSGQGLPDRKLAYFLASYADPLHCMLHSGKVNTAVTLMFVQAALSFLVVYFSAYGFEPTGRLVFSSAMASISLLFAWGFYRHAALAYNVFLALSVAGASKQFSGFSLSSMVTWIAPALSVGLFCFIFYVRQSLFPDFVYLSPKKIKGKYVFKD